MLLELASIVASVLLSAVAADQSVAGSAPASSYGVPAPASSYGVPAATYGAPAPSYGQPGPYAQLAPAPEAVQEFPEEYYKYNTIPEQGLEVQTGYEGFLAPNNAFGLKELLPIGGALTAIKTAFWAVFPLLKPLLTMLLLGGAFTTAVCTLTPICTLSLPFLPFTRTTTARTSLPLGSLTQTTSFVLNAVDKYLELSDKVAAGKSGKARR